MDTRLMRALIFCLLAASGSAVAQLPPAGAIVCDTPVYQVDPDGLARARQALDTARAAPGPHDLALAAAQADLAFATARQSGPQPQRDANRKAALDLAERAGATWKAAPASAALAQEILRRGRTARAAAHCPLALNLLESALAVADKTGGANDPVSLSVARELMLLATAMGDDPTVNALAPRLFAALDADPAPFDGINYNAYLAATDHYYRSEDHERAEALVNRLIDKAKASGADALKLRRLDFERASIYYAQGRYREAEALAALADRPQAKPDGLRADLARVEEDMAVQVRSGRLQAALATGEAQLPRLEAGRAASAAALQAAEADWEAAKKEGKRDAMAAARTRYATARRDGTIWQLGLAGMESYVGEVQHALGRLDLALPLYEKALDHYPAAGGANVYDIERVRADMALVYRARGDTARALALQQQVKQALLPLLGARHPDVLEAEAQIAQLSNPTPEPAPAPATPPQRKK
ncbi:tetratricopeptide repeat protein [Massilia sp. YIM B02769]|uniref:tetratricopeptide repeat protein n=1 Tax=Massilia sp. YIM B02769 TaxID=3050129 RepID=UPI0025B65094|nr:tetratricopeptide repeat protein [Massilia sp. YIM B02769]MDN4058643.1 tetratricopeptide repeat protein [Massilia sp. YIM B02769]